VLENSWANWCEPCVKEIPSLQRLQDAMNGKPFTLLAVDVEESRGTVWKFAVEVGIDFPPAARPWLHNRNQLGNRHLSEQFPDQHGVPDSPCLQRSAQLGFLTHDPGHRWYLRQVNLRRTPVRSQIGFQSQGCGRFFNPGNIPVRSSTVDTSTQCRPFNGGFRVVYPRQPFIRKRKWRHSQKRHGVPGDLQARLPHRQSSTRTTRFARNAFHST